VRSYESQALPGRPSDAERERAIEVLKEGTVRGRLSHDTFVRRLDLAMRAGSRGELDALTADLAADGALSRWVLRVTGASAAFTQRLRTAWQSEKLPRLMLPEPGPHPLRIGRDFACGLRIAHDSVSRAHAELALEGGVWILRDLGSMNGTWVNGTRVTGAVPVRPGDRVRFGQVGYRLAAR